MHYFFSSYFGFYKPDSINTNLKLCSSQKNKATQAIKVNWVIYVSCEVLLSSTWSSFRRGLV